MASSMMSSSEGPQIVWNFAGEVPQWCLPSIPLCEEELEQTWSSSSQALFHSWCFPQGGSFGTVGLGGKSSASSSLEVGHILCSGPECSDLLCCMIVLENLMFLPLFQSPVGEKHEECTCFKF